MSTITINDCVEVCQADCRDLFIPNTNRMERDVRIRGATTETYYTAFGADGEPNFTIYKMVVGEYEQLRLYDRYYRQNVWVGHCWGRGERKFEIVARTSDIADNKPWKTLDSWFLVANTGATHNGKPVTGGFDEITMEILANFIEDNLRTLFDWMNENYHDQNPT